MKRSTIMKLYSGNAVLESSRAKLKALIEKNRLQDAEVTISVKTLTPEEAMGGPVRRNFPIIIGKERIIEAEILGARAHAFTDSPAEFSGKLRDALNLSLETNKERAMYVAALNALLKRLVLISQTLHCKDDEPEQCGKEIASFLFEKHGKARIGLIGFNPAIAEKLANVFGNQNLRITDLNRQNTGVIAGGIEIWDGEEKTGELIQNSDVVLVTGTTIVNGTFDEIFRLIHENKKEYYVFGVTGSGICAMMGLNRICPCGRD